VKVKAYNRTERICMGEQYLDARTGAGAGGAREQGTNAGAGELDFRAQEHGSSTSTHGSRGRTQDDGNTRA